LGERARRLRRAGLGLLALGLAGCAGLASGAAVAPPAALGPEAPVEEQLRQRLIGRWDGRVDLTFPDATLMVDAVRREADRWVVEAAYGTTNLVLAAVPAALEVSGADIVLAFTTDLGAARLRLVADDDLRGTLTLAGDGRPRELTLRRRPATRGIRQPRPSTAVERVTRTLESQERPAVVAAAPPAASPAAEAVVASRLGALAEALPPLLLGRWEGSVDFTVSARLLVVDAVRPEGGGWVVQARFGVADADLGPVSVTLDLTEDRVDLRFQTSLASRVALRLHADETLRGALRLPFETRERRMELRRARPPRKDPPTIVLRAPVHESRVGQPEVVVAAAVSATSPLVEITVSLNGEEVHRQEGRAQRSLALTVPLALREGVNTVVVTARDADGGLRQEVAAVSYAPGAAPGPPPAAAAPVARERWAVVIGAGRYDHQGIPPLRYAAADAEAVHRTLVQVAGFKPENVILMTDRTERKPTLRNLRQVLGTFLARAPRKDDTVVIFFAGHGAPEVDPRGVERDGLAKYLVPVDADPDDLYATALPMDEIRTIFERIEAERVVVFLDTCYSGAAGGRTFSTKGIRAGGLDEGFLERIGRAKGRAIVTASRPSEVSLELAELGHGIFTYYLTRGLGGAADANRDGVVSLQELYEYLAREVAAKSRAVGGNQHPVLKGELEGVLPLAGVRR
jgi:uncharacterized caspase-like protein